MEAQVEILSDVLCQCCLSTENLKSMTEPFIVGNKIEIYYDMINKCFTNNLMRDKTRVDSDYNLFICDACVDTLRLCHNFRKQVERAQTKLQVYKLTLTLQDTQQHTIYDHDSKSPTAVKEETPNNDASGEDFFFTDSVENQSGNCNQTLHITHIDTYSNTKDKNTFKTLSDKQYTTLERKVKNALTKIKSSQIYDKLIDSESKTYDDPLQVTDSTQKRHDTVVDVAGHAALESLHQRIVHLVNTTTVDANDTTNNDFVMPKPKKKRQKMTNEEYRRRCRIYFKKRRRDLKPYQLNESDNKCSNCGEEFYSYQSLVAHMNEHYPQYICDKCGKAFAVRSALRAHVRIHDEGIPCEICNKKIMKRNLSKHVNAHLGKKDVHRCPVCNERFEKFSSRALHMEKEHNIVKRYTCKWCEKVFNLAANLNLHIRDQHNPFVRMQVKSQNLIRKPRAACFECAPCGKTFRQKLHLEHHQISKHSNEKNYQCHICLRSYFLKYTLNQHMKDYHYETSKFACHICNKVFKVKRMVTRHVKRVHNKQTNAENEVDVEQSNVDNV